MPKLTTRYLRTLKAREREYKAADSELPRFMARVRTSGRIYFGVQYRHGGRFRWMTLGRFGEVTADQARREALGVLAEVERGGDPAAVRDQERNALSFAELADRWIEQHVTPKRKASTAKEDQRLLDKIIRPKLGRRLATDVTRADLSRLHAGLAKTPITANRVLSLLHALFAFGERIGARPEATNPARGITRYREEARRRYLSDAELARLGAVLAEAERTGAETPGVVACIRLLLLTGCRKSELLGARWRDVDFARGLLHLEDAKAGPRDVHLSPPALAVLEGLSQTSEWIIPGRDARAALVNISKPWRRIRKSAGLEDVRLHDLRHSHASVGVATGASLHVLGGLLGHRQPRTTGRYAHLSDDPLRRASDAIGSRLAAALAQQPDAPLIRLDEATSRRR